MAIRAFAADSAVLLAKLKKAAGPNGDAKTWALDAKGNFIHKTDQWEKAGSFSASAEDGYVHFRWTGEQSEKKENAYEYLHGRLSEMLMLQGRGIVTKVTMWDPRTK